MTFGPTSTGCAAFCGENCGCEARHTYTDGEIAAFREQRKRANAIMKRAWEERGVTIHPRVAAMRPEKGSP